LTAELLQNFGPLVDRLTLIPDRGGQFEIEVNGTLIYSKLATGRHANPGEVQTLLKKYLQDNS
jgi:selenoprotein W-related protein